MKVSLRDAFHIGLVIGPRSAVLAAPPANTAGLGPITIGQYEKHHIIIL
jgi:hypothetical protein